MTKTNLTAMTLFSCLILAGCGTMNGSRFQHIAVSTFENGQQLDGVTCTLSNKKGSWEIVTQGATQVQKSYGDLSIVCEKAGHGTGFAVVKSEADSLLPNFLIGGAVGSTVDTVSESIFVYPSNIVIYMGHELFIPPASELKKAQ